MLGFVAQEGSLGRPHCSDSSTSTCAHHRPRLTQACLPKYKPRNDLASSQDWPRENLRASSTWIRLGWTGHTL
jgi:hypothetical protein